MPAQRAEHERAEQRPIALRHSALGGSQCVVGLGALAQHARDDGSRGGAHGRARRAGATETNAAPSSGCAARYADASMTRPDGGWTRMSRKTPAPVATSMPAAPAATIVPGAAAASAPSGSRAPDAQSRAVVEAGLRDGPRIEGAHARVELERAAPPVEHGLRLRDLRRVSRERLLLQASAKARPRAAPADASASISAASAASRS